MTSDVKYLMTGLIWCSVKCKKMAVRRRLFFFLPKLPFLLILFLKFQIRLNLDKQLRIKINERSLAQRFDDSMSSLSSEDRIQLAEFILETNYPTPNLH